MNWAHLNRRTALFTSLAAGFATGLRAQPAPAFRNALSVSPFAEMLLSAGVTFVDGPRTAHDLRGLQEIFRANGSGEIFARIDSRAESDPKEAAINSLRQGLVRARLAAAMDMPLNPELTLCAHYGDVSLQPEPDFSGYPNIKLRAPWFQLSLDEMAAAFRAYGAIAARLILATGCKVNIWDIGNEVEMGIAGIAIRPFAKADDGWTYTPPDTIDPALGRMDLKTHMMMSEDEQISWDQVHLWPYVARILVAVADGIRSVDPTARFNTHSSGIIAVQPKRFTAFYRALEQGGFRPLQLGTSYYPCSTPRPPDRLKAFQDTATAAFHALGKQIFVAEFAYAAGPISYGGQNWTNPVGDYPCTPEGQAAFTRDLVAWGARTGVLGGLRPWGPELIGRAPGDGWGGNAFFENINADKQAIARPGLAAIQRGLAVAH